MKQVFILTTALLVLIISCTSKIDFTSTNTGGNNNGPHYASDLLISEISTAINTDSVFIKARNHYVEIYNGTNASVDLSNYAIGYLAVNNTDSLYDWTFRQNTFLALSNQLDTGKCYVIASHISDTILLNPDTTWGTKSGNTANASRALQLSGNSAIALLKKDPAGAYTLGADTYKIIDVFGSPNVSRILASTNSGRNNYMWAIAGDTSDTRNMTFKRKATIKDPSIDWEVSRGTDATNSQWILSVSRVWDYSNVGLPTQ